MKDFFEQCDYWYCPDTEEQTTDRDEVTKWKTENLPVMAIHSQLLITDAQGIYIPQIFYNNFEFDAWNLKKSE